MSAICCPAAVRPQRSEGPEPAHSVENTRSLGRISTAERGASAFPVSFARLLRCRKNLGQFAEVLGGGGEEEFVICAPWSAQSETVEAKDPLEMVKPDRPLSAPDSWLCPCRLARGSDRSSFGGTASALAPQGKCIGRSPHPIQSRRGSMSRHCALTCRIRECGRDLAVDQPAQHWRGAIGGIHCPAVHCVAMSREGATAPASRSRRLEGELEEALPDLPGRGP